jgi:hypothetical protein
VTIDSRLQRRLHRFGSVAKEGFRYRVIRPLGAPRRAGAVVMLHTARCGSTVLARMLGQHPSIHDDGELYLPTFEHFAAMGTTPRDSGFDAVDHVRSHLSRSGRRWYVFDVQFDHMVRLHGDPASFLSGLGEIGVSRIIVLRRLNLVRKITSTLMAQRRGRWYVPAGEPAHALEIRVPDGPFVVDGRSGTLIEHLDRYRVWYDRAEQLVAEQDAEALWLDYETHLMEDPAVGYRMVLDFLGLPFHTAEITTQRLNTRPLSEVVVNLDEVRGWLSGSSYEWMLSG